MENHKIDTPKDDKIYKIFLVKSIPIDNISQEKLDEDFTEELYYYITPEEIIQNKIAVIGDDTFYVRCDKPKINELNYFLSKYHEIEITDVSEEIIKSNEIYNSINKKDMDQYGDLFDNYRLEFTTKDDVLDKIIKFGIDYLDHIDKDILDEN